jgi:hypothetical protein
LQALVERGIFATESGFPVSTAYVTFARQSVSKPSEGFTEAASSGTTGSEGPVVMRKCGRSVARYRAFEPIRGIVWAFTLAVVLQSVASIATNWTHSRSVGPIPLTTASDVPCSRTNDNHAPTHRADDAACCILCAGRDAEDAPLSDMTLIEDMLALEGSFSRTRIHFFVLVFKPTDGWGSSWSSRAPPVFS